HPTAVSPRPTKVDATTRPTPAVVFLPLTALASTPSRRSASRSRRVPSTVGTTAASRQAGQARAGWAARAAGAAAGAEREAAGGAEGGQRRRGGAAQPQRPARAVECRRAPVVPASWLTLHRLPPAQHCGQLVRRVLQYCESTPDHSAGVGRRSPRRPPGAGSS